MIDSSPAAIPLMSAPASVVAGTPADHGGVPPTSAGEIMPRSPLDKPLAELTERDIAQLTREDARRFLKSKGMRRPSWNKSQAIQQVISLKALLEGTPGCDDCPAGVGIFQKSSPPPAPVFPLQDSSPPSPKDGGGSQPPAKEPSPYRRRDPIPPSFSAGADPRPLPEIRCLFPRATAELPAGQMTIVYDGVVNVYDGLPMDQARAVLELAASAVSFDDVTGPVSPAFRPTSVLPELGPVSVPTVPSLAKTVLVAASGRVAHHAAGGLAEPRGTPPAEPGKTAERLWRVKFAAHRVMGRLPRGLGWKWERVIFSLVFDPEGQRRPLERTETGMEMGVASATSRKGSLQRYMEKRKDRFKAKKLLKGSTSSNMEMMYFSRKLKFPNLNELTTPNDTSFSALFQQPQSPGRCSSGENQVQREKFFIDLNGAGELNFVLVDICTVLFLCM
ncbi:leaf development [Musa troglodytarum]|uniref:Protein TIFY n=1 Tax=Musa troglodytarum TaxID=320322 RepID=A0A9E7HH78_9LILI|nr:leaf development [Musa troglodytarum]